MSPEQDDDPTPDWQLERYLLGELPAPETAALREALENRAGLRDRLAALERSNAEILDDHPPAAAATAIRRLGRATPGVRRPLPSGFRASLALAVGAAAVAAVALLAPARPTPPEARDVTRVKGLSPRLLLFRHADSAGVERLEPGAVARARDLVQLAYQAADRRHGVIVSVDGRGTVTRHLPVSGGQAAVLEAGPPVPLPEAYELDDAPGFERFYLVAADEPFAVETVVEAVRRGRSGPRLDLPSSMEQYSFVLSKETAR